MDAMEALRERRSVRAYTMRAVAEDVVTDLIDCARVAPSAMNLQPCRFVVVTEPAARAEIAALCEYGSFIADAPVAVAIVAKNEGHYLEDAACAATYIMVGARAHGIGTCWVHVHGKDHEPDIAELLGVPEGYRVVAVLSLGYGEIPPAPPKLALDQVLFWQKMPSDD